MAQLGSKKKPAIVRVCSEARAQEVLAVANDAGVQIVIGIEPDKTEDISDLRKAIKKREEIFLTMEARPSKNAPCPCGSGRKFKGCCGKNR